MSWNKESFKDKWKDEPTTKYWVREWHENYTRYETEFDIILDTLLKVEWNSLLEIGCGMGKNLVMIGKKFKKKELYGTDINKPFLEIARINGLNVKEQDTESLEHEKVDIVLSYEHLQHMHPDAYAKSVNRIKEVGKYVLIYEGQKKGGGVIKSGSGGRWSHDYKKDFGGEIVFSKECENGYALLIIKL